MGNWSNGINCPVAKIITYINVTYEQESRHLIGEQVPTFRTVSVKRERNGSEQNSPPPLLVRMKRVCRIKDQEIFEVH